MEKARRDAVDANALPSPRRGKFARQAKQPRLACGVAGVVRALVEACKPETDAMLMMRPYSRFNISRPAAWANRNAP